MSGNYTRDHLKISVVKILQTLGWNSINSTPLEILTDILDNYMSQIARSTNSYANEFGCTLPNLDHLGLAFRDMGINVSELDEYVKYVNFGPPPNAVPKYPIPKEDHLNFLKPGSKEVVTRPVHIHEHLPPMNPLLEGNKSDTEVSCKLEEPEECSSENSTVFKKPADISPSDLKKLKREEEGSRPTREISSVMMTTSGFLSPAREGKLPESRTPIQSVEPPAPVPEAPELPKKPSKFVKKVEKKKPKPGGFLEQVALDEKRKKMKAVLKSKQQSKLSRHINPLAQPPLSNDISSLGPIPKINQTNKLNKALAAARLKTEKLNTTITPITVNTPAPSEPDNINKLFTEPDKKKMHIFKKISNVKNDVKTAKKEETKPESRESSPDLIIDEPEAVVSKLTHLSNDVTIEPIQAHKSPDKIDAPYFDDDSQPGTPSTPKTPEMVTHSPPLVKEKRKRKDGKKAKKIPKVHALDTDALDMDMERPKTPEASQVLSKLDMSLPPFPFHFGGPGLIPPPNLFGVLNDFRLPTKNIPNFGQKPFMPSPIAQKPPEAPPVEEPPQPKPKPESPQLDASKKTKEHKKEKKDKKRNKKDKIKNKADKKKLKEEKKEKIKKERKEKRKEKEANEGVKITLKIKSPSPRPETPETRKLNIKPVVRKEEPEAPSEERSSRETSPGLAKISALVCGPPKAKPAPPPPQPPPADAAPPEDIPITPPRNGPGRPRIHPIKQKPTAKPKKRRTPVKKDADGNEVWICPACGRQDDGSPMIGCDGCDAWYHWVCVGIQVPPDPCEDWYCRHCLLKKNEDLQSDKQKKKRKKREKKDH